MELNSAVMKIGIASALSTSMMGSIPTYPAPGLVARLLRALFSDNYGIVIKFSVQKLT